MDTWSSLKLAARGLKPQLQVGPSSTLSPAHVQCATLERQCTNLAHPPAPVTLRTLETLLHHLAQHATPATSTEPRRIPRRNSGPPASIFTSHYSQIIQKVDQFSCLLQSFIISKFPFSVRFAFRNGRSVHRLSGEFRRCITLAAIARR